jgi:hypothetical protein
MIRKRTALVTVALLFFFLSPGALLAQTNDTPKGNPPFLITGKLPHLTKLLMVQWENAELHLSDEQKTKLLVVRKETMGDAKRIGKEVGILEQRVTEGSLNGTKPEELQSLVQDIAKLKSEATMVHLRCIYKTSKVLDQKQLDFLKG